MSPTTPRTTPYVVTGLPLAPFRPGAALEQAIARLFARDEAAYLHAHNAGMGCFVARIDRG